MVVSEKIWFEFLPVHDLGSRSRNDVDLQYSHTFINLIGCLFLPTFRSLAALSEKSTAFTFAYRNAYVSKFVLGLNYVLVNPGSSFVQTIMGWSPRCYIPSFVEIGPPVPEEKIYKGFYHIWAWRPSWSCDLDRLYKLWFPLPKKAPR